MFIILILAVLLLGLNAYVIFRIKDFLNPKVLLAKLTRAAEVAYDKRRIRQEAVRLLHRNNLKPSKMDLLEIKFIDKTNLRRILPFINLKLIVVLELFIVGVAFQLLLSIFVFPPTTLVMSFLIAGVPIMALDLIGRYNSTKVRRRLCDFVSCIGRWIAVKEDLVYRYMGLERLTISCINLNANSMVVRFSPQLEARNILRLLELRTIILIFSKSMFIFRPIRQLVLLLARQYGNTVYPWQMRL